VNENFNNFIAVGMHSLKIIFYLNILCYQQCKEDVEAIGFVLEAFRFICVFFANIYNFPYAIAIYMRVRISCPTGLYCVQVFVYGLFLFEDRFSVLSCAIHLRPTLRVTAGRFSVDDPCKNPIGPTLRLRDPVTARSVADWAQLDGFLKQCKRRRFC